MKKLLSTILLIILFCAVACIPASAFERPEHDNYTECVLFGEFHSNALNEKQQNAIKLLDCALYLTIDQFNGYGVGEYSTLKDAGVVNLPELYEINFTANSSTHRSYTQRVGLQLSR